MKHALHIKTDGTIEHLSIHPDTELEQLQKAVGGYIELIHTRTPRRDMYVNEEGLIRNMPNNSMATGLVQAGTLVVGLIRGDVVIMLQPRDTKTEDETPAKTLERMYGFNRQIP